MFTIGLVDDHTLIRKGLSALCASLGYSIVLEAESGFDMVRKLNPYRLPDVMLLDINMPGMNGIEAASWLEEHYPSVKKIALSLNDKETSIIRMIRNGVKGFLLKDGDPYMIKKAIDTIFKYGYYTQGLVHDSAKGTPALSEHEKNYLQYACDEITDKEIAEKLLVSPNKIDEYRRNLFEKCHVSNRPGLVMYALNNQLVSLQ